MSKLTESDVEQANLDWLSGLGWAIAHGPDLAPEGKSPERTSYGDLLLLGRLKDAIARINPQLPSDKLRIEVKKILKKYGYPPELQDAAVRLVLQQAGVLAPL